MTREYYQKNRERILKATAERHYNDIADSDAYLELVRARKQMWNFTESIKNYRTKIQDIQKRMAHMREKIERLELQRGHERAIKKGKTTT